MIKANNPMFTMVYNAYKNGYTSQCHEHGKEVLLYTDGTFRCEDCKDD